MGRPKKENPKCRQLRIRMRENEFNWLDSLSKSFGMTKTDVILSALIGYFDYRQHRDIALPVKLLLQQIIDEKYSEIHKQVLDRIKKEQISYDLEDLQEKEWALYKFASLFDLTIKGERKMTKEEIRCLTDEELYELAKLNKPDICLLCSAELARRAGCDENKLLWTIEDVDRYFTQE